jgi:Tol biopolymer transport system component
MPSSPVEADQDDEGVPPARVVAGNRSRALIVGALTVAAILIVANGSWVDRTQKPATQGGEKTVPTPTPSAAPGPGTYLIDLNTGEMTPLPKSISGFKIDHTVSPDGTMVAYTSPDDAGTLQVFIANLDGTDVQQVTHDRRGASTPAWSSDGEAIVYFNGAGQGSIEQGDVLNIFVLDLATGETRQVTNEKPPNAADFPQFSPDGASIVYDLYHADGVALRIVPVTGGKSVPLVGGGKSDVNAATGAFSPDGSTLAVGCSGRLEGICIADAEGTNLRTLVSGPWLTFPRWSPDGTRIAYTDQTDHSDPRIFVVDVATGETTFVAEGFANDWLDDHTLIAYQGG